MKQWFTKLFWRLVWGKPKNPSMNLRNPAPKAYGPKRRKIKKY